MPALLEFAMDVAAPADHSNRTSASVPRHYDALFWPYRLFWGHHLHHGLFLTGKESPREAQVSMLRHCVAMLPGGITGRVLDVGSFLIGFRD